MAQGRDKIIIDVLGNTKPLEKNIAKVANQALILNTKGFSQPLGKISGQLGEFEKSLAASNARVIAFGASAGAIYAIKKAFDETIRSVIEVEKSLTDINVILNVSQKNLTSFGNNLFDIAKNTGASFAEVAKAATEFSRQGLGIEDTLKRTSDALILTRLSGLSTVDSVEALTAAVNSFTSSAITSTEVVNKLAAVDAGFAVSSADLAEAIKRVGSSADDTGVSFDQLIALVTSAQQITSRGGSVIGNSLKTIFTRLQRPKTLDSLEEIGIATKDQEGNILPLIQILNNLSQTYEKLGSVQRAQIAETVGGVFQINVLKASLSDLSKEYSIYSQALATSSGASNEAISRNEALNETLSATINKTVANLQQGAVAIGNLALAPAMKKSLDGLNYVLENFGTDQTEGIGAKIGEGLAKGLGNFLSGPGLLLGAASLVKIFERLTVFTADAFKQLTGLNTQSAEQKALQSQILTLISKNPQIIEQINSDNLDTVSLHKQILTLIEQETVAMERQVAVANSLTKSLMNSGVTIAQSGPMRGAAVKNKALGFIPNFSANQEVMGALAGGYAPGQIKQTFIPNYGQVTYNSAETVKKFPGMSQAAIMPPKGSTAGKSYQKNFQAAHGFNPYNFDGFVPNFKENLLLQEVEKGMVLVDGAQKKFLESNLAKQYFIKYKDWTIAKGKNGSAQTFIKADKAAELNLRFRQNIEENAIARGQAEGKNYPYTLIFPGAGIAKGEFPTHGLNSKKQQIGFTAFPFPVGKGDFGQKTFEQVQNSIVNVAKKIVSDAGLPRKKFNTNIFSNTIKSNLSLDAVNSFIGNAFEAGLMASIGAVGEDRNRNLDVSAAQMRQLAATFPSAAALAGKKGGDFKASLDTGLLNSMADKISRSEGLAALGFIPNFAVFNANKHIQRGGFVGRSNKSTAEGLSNLTSLMGINYSGPITKQNLTQLFSSKENKKKLYEFLKKQPILIKQYPELYSEVKDGNHRFELAQLAGIKNIPAEYLAKGFIPNFASIKDAMETEKKMGGNPTLDFQPGVGLYVRDSKTQPNFAAVKRDHPEGLNAAMGNSYAIQKSMAAFGFIPNFAALTAQEMSASAALAKGITGDTPLKKLYKEAGKSAEGLKETKFDLDKYREKLIFASFGLSMIGGFGSELAGDNELLEKNINNLSSGLSASLTAVQLIPGPAGLVAGGLGALYSVANAVANQMKYGGKDLGKKLESIKEESSNFANAASNYTKTLEQLKEAYANPKASTETITKLNNELATIANDIPQKYRMQLVAITDSTKLQDETNKIQASLNKELKNLEFAAKVTGKVIEGGGLFTPSVLKSPSLVRGAAQSIYGGLSEEGQAKFLKDVSDNLLKLNQPELISYLEKYYGLNQDISFMLRTINADDFKNALTSLKLYADELNANKRENDAIKNIREEEIKTQDKLKKQTQSAKAAIDSLNTSLNSLINSSIKSQTFKQNFNANVSANTRQIALSKAEGLLNYEELFKSQESLNATREGINALNRGEEFAKQVRETQSSSKQAMLEIGANLLEDLRKPNQENPQSEAAINSYQDKLLNISNQNLSPQATADALNRAISSSFGKDFEKSSEIQTKINDEARQQNEKLATLSEEQKKANTIALNNYNIQQKILQARRDIDTAGGIQSFLDPETFKKRKEIFNKYRRDYNRGQDRQDIVRQGRGAAGMLSEIVQFSGGSLSPGAQEDLSDLKDIAIKGRAADIRRQAKYFASRTPGVAGEAYSRIGYRAEEIATAQINNLTKDQNIGQNVDEITKLLRGVTTAQTKTVIPQLNTSIQNALQVIQKDLTPSINNLKTSLDKANEVFSGRELYQTIAEKLGQQKMLQVGSTARLAESNLAMEKLIPSLKPALYKRAEDMTTTYSEEGTIYHKDAYDKLVKSIDESFARKEKINVSDLGIEQNTPLSQLVTSYNNQADAAENSRAQMQGSTEALEDLNSQIVYAADNLFKLGQTVIPVGNLANPTNPTNQNIQGSVDVNIPNNNLLMNVDGTVNFNPGKFEITFAEDSNLKTLVTPIIDDWWKQAQVGVQQKINDQIFDVRQDAGLKKKPTPFGR
jgi:TP901 family phage tail tape measure protein